MEKNKPSKKTAAIVIPTFNRAKLVTKAIDTALAQTYPCQVIVCDHGSRDNTPQVMKKYGKKITYIRREKDFGPHFCWLEGVLNADAEFVHIHMDDDWLEPTYMEKTIALMDDNVGMVFSDARCCYFEAGKTDVNVLQVKERFGDTGVYLSALLETHILRDRYMLSPAACLYRKQDIIDAIYPGNLPVDFGPTYFGVGPDHFMTLQALLRYPKFGVVNESLLTFAHHKGSITVNAYETKEKTEHILSAYDSVRRYYLLMKKYRENPEMINLRENYKPSKEITNIKLWGLPFVKIKRKQTRFTWYFLGIPVWTYVHKNDKSRGFVFGLPFFTVKSKQS